MRFLWSFLVLCLYLATELTWGQSFNPTSLRQRRRPTPSVVMPRNFSPNSVREAFSRASDVITRRRDSPLGRRRPASLTTNTAAARHKAFLAAGSRTIRLENIQELFEEATRLLLTEFNLTPAQIMFGLTHTDLKTMLEGNEVQTCESQFNFTTCQANNRYRSYDGTCNNLKHPSWGMASSCFERLVDPDYGDGTADKRTAMSGNELPSPRRVSLEIHAHFENPTDYVNHMFMAFGQFIAHDITLTPQSTGPNNEILECCPIQANDPPNCDPIVIGADDPFFRSFNIECLDNSRSAICSTCNLGPRQQTDQVTSYIDCSHIYGLNQNEARRLRRNATGLLNSVTVGESGELMPGSFTPNEDQCSFQDPNFNCFQTGDQRGNQHPALTSLHAIFLREHNRIARRLSEINTRWDDERLYQEARRILIAEMQMITYSEYLPLLLGPERMQWFDLSVRPGNEFTQYDETVQATLANEFATAGYRMGHSMINSFFQQSRGSNGGNYLRDIFNFPFGLYRGELDGMVEGLTASPSQKFDRHMVRDVTNHLYQNRGNQTGLDLAALNINRGRDHGIPGYTTLVEFCGGPEITTWRELDRLFQRGVRPLFERLYERVEDIDLFSGGLAERPNQGAVIGPTFTCINGIQFYHLKFGDRFYFEHGGQAGSFTSAQLQEIKKMRLGKIVCQNTGINEMPENVFLFEGNRNPMQRCESKPDIDFNAWRE